MARAKQEDAECEGHPSPAGSAALRRRVGENVRRRRKSLKLSLSDLSQVSGVSRAALSQIETFRSNPTMGVLWRIAVGLAIPFTELLGERPETVHVHRRAETEPLRSPDGKLESRPVTGGGAADGLEIRELRLAAGGVHVSQAHPRGTRGVVVVLVGQLRLRLAHETYDLDPGDSITFDADRSHVLENPGASEGCYQEVVLYERA